MVPSDTLSRRLISRFDRPSATSASTSRSRVVSSAMNWEGAANDGRWRRATVDASGLDGVGRSTCPESSNARNDASSRAGATCLLKQPTAPAASARCAIALDALGSSNTTRIPGAAERRSAMPASTDCPMPNAPRMTSAGTKLWRTRCDWGTELTWPITSIDGSRPSKVTSPKRHTLEGSMINTLLDIATDRTSATKSIVGAFVPAAQQRRHGRGADHHSIAAGRHAWSDVAG